MTGANGGEMPSIIQDKQHRVQFRALVRSEDSPSYTDEQEMECKLDAKYIK